MATKLQIAANRANAQLSTGPKTGEGKSKTSHNALKTGLTGRAVVLPSDDVAAYEQHVSSAFTQWKPETDREKALVQSIADTDWRLLRIPTLESGIYALGHLQFAEMFTDQAEELRAILLEAYIFQSWRRDLTNLSLQESRLRRQREKDCTELILLLKERRARRDAQLTAAAHMYTRFKENGDPFDPLEFGFEFSFHEIEERVALFEARDVRSRYPEQYAKIRAKELRQQRLAA
jgi:hypothetical protein